MTTASRIAISLGFALLLLGCDRAEKRAAEEEALREQPPVETGNVGQAMQAERVDPKLPTPDDRLLLAVRKGSRREAEGWLSEGAAFDPAAPVLVTAVRGKGDLAFLEWLIDRGVAIDTPDAAGRTPLSWAAARGSLEQVRFLLDRGADITKADQLARTPLHFAVFSGEDDVVNALLDAKSNVNAQDTMGTTPLMYACAKNQPTIVKTLQNRGADPKLEDKLGRTAAERAHGDNNPCKQ